MGGGRKPGTGPRWLRWWLPRVERTIVRVGAFAGAVLAIIAAVVAIWSWLDRPGPTPVPEPLELAELRATRLTLGDYVADLTRRGEKLPSRVLRPLGLGATSEGPAGKGRFIVQLVSITAGNGGELTSQAATTTGGGGTTNGGGTHGSTGGTAKGGGGGTTTGGGGTTTGGGGTTTGGGGTTTGGGGTTTGGGGTTTGGGTHG